MLLDEVFGNNAPQCAVIIRKNGKIQHSTKPLLTSKVQPLPNTPLFPISKDRK